MDCSESLSSSVFVKSDGVKGSYALNKSDVYDFLFIIDETSLIIFVSFQAEALAVGKTQQRKIGSILFKNSVCGFWVYCFYIAYRCRISVRVGVVFESSARHYDIA